MKVLFDTNVVLDLLLDREPFADVAERLIGRVERRQIEGLLGATTITTVHYLVAKGFDAATARGQVRDLLQLFAIAAVDGQVLELAAASPIADFEDAVLHEAGRVAGAEVVVTRDPEDFQEGSLPVVSPEELWAAITLAERGTTPDS